MAEQLAVKQARANRSLILLTVKNRMAGDLSSYYPEVHFQI